MGNHIDRTSDLAKAVNVLRQQEMTMSLPMQTAEVDEDVALTADQILEIGEIIFAMEREELDRRKNRQKIEQLAMKIRAQLDQLSGPK